MRQPGQEGTEKEVRVYCKGGPDFMLKDNLVKNILCQDGSVAEISDKPENWPAELQVLSEELGGETHLGMMQSTLKLFASQAYRTILTCYRDMSMTEFEAIAHPETQYDSPEAHAAIESELTAIGIFGLEDPLKPGINEAITACQIAGIRVIMCTGDNIDTAKAISVNAGILKADNKEKHFYSMTGEDFRNEVGGLRMTYDEKGKETGEVVKDM